MFLTTLACQIDVGGPARPGERIASDENQATQVAETWSQALSAAIETGEVTVLFDESQITGFVQSRMQTNDTPLLANPQIYLRDGQILVHGIFERGIFKASALLRIEPFIGSDGELSMRLIEATVGPIPAPDLLMESVSALLTEALTGSVGSLATGIRITSIAISNGEMAIVGQLR
jgi:hypothetical protein